MKVRLAFASLTEVEADILLLDEVLAVGDAEFQEKCEAVFERMQAAGKTIVLVTHSMGSINAHCDRALLLHEGRQEGLGAAIEMSNRYLELNMRAAATAPGDEAVTAHAARFADVIADPPIRIVEASLLGTTGAGRCAIAPGEPIELLAVAEIAREVREPRFQFRIDDVRGQAIFQSPPSETIEPGIVVESGERLKIRVAVDNPLAPGCYVLAGGMTQRLEDGSVGPATPVTSLAFEIDGAQAGDGLVRLEHEVSVALERTEPGRPEAD